MRLFLLLLLLCTCAFGLGHTSINTLAFPYGSENEALGEAGTAFSNGLPSTFYNPANGVFYGERENIHVAFNAFHEYLLPGFDFDDMWHKSLNVGFFTPDIIPNWSFSFSFGSNKVNYGLIKEYIESDLNDTVSWFEYHDDGTKTLVWGYVDSCNAYEAVNSFSLSASYKKSLAVGISWSHFESRLSKSSFTEGWAMDIGLRAQREFYPNDFTYLIPGVGLSLTGINNDFADYDTTDQDPGHRTPHTLHAGISLEGGMKDILYGVLLFDIHQEMIKDHKDTYDDPMFSPGLQLGFTPFMRCNGGFMIDKQGQREEFHWGFTTGFQQQRARNFFTRILGHMPNSSDKNVQILYSFSHMVCLGDNDVRIDQNSHTVTVAMGFGNKRNKSTTEVGEELQLWEE